MSLNQERTDAEQASSLPAKTTPSAPQEHAEEKEFKLFDFKSISPKLRSLWVLILGMLAAFGPVCTDIYLPALPDLTASFRTDPTVMQLSLTACFIGLAAGQIIIGPLSDSMGRRWPLVLSLLIFAVTSFCCALAPNVQILIALRLFQGFAGAGGVVLCRSMACDMFMGNELTKFMALLMTVNSLAPILGPLAGSAIVSFGSWHWLFLVLAVWGVVLLLGALFILRETLPKERRESRIKQAVMDMFLQLIEKRFLVLALGLSAIMGGFFAYLAASPFVLQVIYGFSAMQYALVFGINACFITVCSLLSGRLEKRLGAVFIVKNSFLIMIISSIGMLIAAFVEPEKPYLVIISLLGFVAMLGSSQTPGFGIVMAARTKGAGAASGIFGVLGFVLGSITSPLVGLMGDRSMVPLALCMFISAVVSYILFIIGMRMKPRASKN